MTLRRHLGEVALCVSVIALSACDVTGVSECEEREAPTLKAEFDERAGPLPTPEQAAAAASAMGFDCSVRSEGTGQVVRCVRFRSRNAWKRPIGNLSWHLTLRYDPSGFQRLDLSLSDDSSL